MTTFETAAGVTVPAVTAAEMREVDRVAVETVGLELLQMMENAGRAFAATLLDRREATADGTVVVLAGNGGNGGGGLCAARHLANRGVDVTVVLDRDRASLSGAAARQRRILEETDVAIGDESALGGADVVGDALVGYGLTSALRGRAADLVTAANEGEAPVVALDVPSGLDATTGAAPGVAVDADRTLTLALPKTGLVDCDDVSLADIGIPAGVYERLGLEYGTPFGESDRVSVRPTARDSV
jgi:NAD(P)H-hydrate epimerase